MQRSSWGPIALASFDTDLRRREQRRRRARGVRARAAYWRGRAAEAAGQFKEKRASGGGVGTLSSVWSARSRAKRAILVGTRELAVSDHIRCRPPRISGSRPRLRSPRHSRLAGVFRMVFTESLSRSGLRDDLRLHLPGSPNRPSSYGVVHAASQTPPAFARYNPGSLGSNPRCASPSLSTSPSTPRCEPCAP
jgi:hypothetical protein